MKANERVHATLEHDGFTIGSVSGANGLSGTLDRFDLSREIELLKAAVLDSDRMNRLG